MRRRRRFESAALTARKVSARARKKRQIFTTGLHSRTICYHFPTVRYSEFHSSFRSLWAKMRVLSNLPQFDLILDRPRRCSLDTRQVLKTVWLKDPNCVLLELMLLEKETWSPRETKFCGSYRWATQSILGICSFVYSCVHKSPREIPARLTVSRTI